MEAEDVAEQVQDEAASIVIVSDFVCPWCYIGFTEVERLAREYDFEVQLAPYLLRPETPPEGMLSRRIVAEGSPPTDTELRAEQLGIKFSRGRTWSSNSHLALEASAFAREHGDAWRYHRAMFKAYFEELEDIGQVETVVRVGASAGLDAAGLRAALEEGRYRQDVDEGITWSRQIGVTAIPTFIFNGRYAMVGAQELNSFRYIMEKVGQTPRA